MFHKIIRYVFLINQFSNNELQCSFKHINTRIFYSWRAEVTSKIVINYLSTYQRL